MIFNALLQTVSPGIGKDFFLRESVEGQTEKIFDIKVSQSSLIDEFYKYHQDFIKKTCSVGIDRTEAKFDKLLKDYKGQGFFIPTLENDELDLDSIREGLDIISEKINWQSEMENYLLNQKDFKSVDLILKDLESSLQKNLKFKEQYFDLEDSVLKMVIQKSALDEMNKLRTIFDRLMIEIPFLQTVRFPINFLMSRLEYERVKNLKGKSNRLKSNKIYFSRRVLEDGASDGDQVKNDIFFRALLSTIYLKLRSDTEFITEDLRYDLVDAIRGAKYWPSLGKSKLLERHRKWKSKTQEQFRFYKTILENKGKLNDQNGRPIDVAEALSLSRYNLKNFVIEKQIETYRYWEELPEIFQALFALESILINEVGGIDGREALERKDILSVVINRRKIKEYNEFLPEDDFYINYKKQFAKTPDSIWLNMMFKEGEFSFTRFFMNASLYSFCPDVSPLGKYLRRENLHLAIESLGANRMRPSFTRYFSRASMVGRIDMGEIWSEDGYRPEYNEIGPEVVFKHLLWKNYKSEHYNYWYHLDFKNKDGLVRGLKIIEIKGQPYVLDLKSQKFFTYRNPQKFRFFQKSRGLSQ